MTNNKYLILLSANDNDSMKQQIKALLNALKEKKYEEKQLKSFAYTLQVGRKALDLRLALLTDSIQDLAEKLEYSSSLIDEKRNFYSKEKKIYIGSVGEEKEKTSSSFIEKCIEEKNYDVLMGSWVCGAYIPWKKMYEGDQSVPEKISLPVCSIFHKKKNHAPQNNAHSNLFSNKDYNGCFLFKPVWVRKNIKKSSDLLWEKRYIVLIEPDDTDLYREIENKIPDAECMLFSEKEQTIVSRYEEYVIRLVQLIKEIMNVSCKNNTLLQIVVQNNQSIIDSRLLMNGIKSFLKTVGSENSKIVYQFIVMDENDDKERIIGRLEENREDHDILYKNNVRYVSGLERLEDLNDHIENNKLKDNGVYLITGGLGKLGLLFAEEILSSTTDPIVILTGRHELSEERSDMLESLKCGNGSLIYRAADISIEKDVEALISWIKEHYGTIDGIIHTAGIIHDNYLFRKQNAEFSEVMKPKTRGTYYLDLYTKDIRLDFFVCFSSAASVFGNQGQSDYTTANGFMDAFAYYRDLRVKAGECSGRTVSINWSLWKCGGMHIPPELEQLMYKEKGLGTIDKENGLKAFYYAIDSNESQLVVLPGNLEKIQEKLADHYEIINGRVDPDSYKKEPIAIIGMSARFPEADNINTLWNNLKENTACFEEIPEKRWDMDPFFESDKEKAKEEGKSYCKWGGFLNDFDKFDSLFFNISPTEAERMDPQERLFMEECWKALEDAGYVPSKMSDKLKKKSGIYGAITKNGFQLWNNTENKSYNTSFASLVNRVSYFMDFGGPSKAVDTMCSSYITAIHEACKDLQCGETELALVGGVNLYLHPYNFVLLSNAGMIADSPESPVFKKNGSGFLPSEGVGAVVLKRLSAAKRDNDNILAIINGSSVIHSGKTNGYSVPDPGKLAEVMENVIRDSDVAPETIRHLEVAANGSKLADAIELAAISKVFSAVHSDKNGYYTLSSVKRNLGHGESVSGLAQLIKAVLQLKNKTLTHMSLPREINDNIVFSSFPFKAGNDLCEWEPSFSDSKEYPRRVLINSLGAGGVYGSIIIEEYNSNKNYSINKTNKKNIFCFSAKSKESLAEILRKWCDHLESCHDADLETISFILSENREEMKYRFAAVAENKEELIRKIQNFMEYEMSNAFDKDISRESISKQEIDNCLKERNLDMIAELWVKRIRIPWRELYGSNKPIQISGLPLYEFRKKSFWVNNSLKAPVVQEKKKCEDDFIFLGDFYGSQNTNEISISSENIESKTDQDNEKLQGIIKEILCNILYLDESDDIDVNDSFMSLGLDSIYAGSFIKRFNEETGLSLKATAMFSYPNIAELSKYATEQINMKDRIKMKQKDICNKLVEMAEKGMFPDASYESNFKNGEASVEMFQKRDYQIRRADVKDIDILLQIEKACWAEGVRAEKEELIKRIESEMCFNFAIVYSGNVVGVIYTQRIKEENLKELSSVDLERARDKDGKCIQAVTLNVFPEYQDRGWGYELLEFVLEYCSLRDDVETVCAVTRCRDAGKSGCKTQEEYMRSIFHDSIFDDPILKFHQLHGAKVIGLIPGYRPNDVDNQGYGVLVKYDINNRPWLGKIDNNTAEKANDADKLFYDHISQKAEGRIINGQNKLSEIGFDSLDMTELLIFINEKLGFSVSMKQLEEKNINELMFMFGDDNTDDAKINESLKKRIRNIMRKYPELVPLSIEGDGPLTFWVHPLSGDVGIYNSFASKLENVFRMVAVKSCGFLSKNKKPLDSVTEMAKYYCEILESIDQNGPYNLAGFSFGGTIAYEMIYQLERKGKKVNTFVMVESPYIKEENKHLFNASLRGNLISNTNFLLVSLNKQENTDSVENNEITEEDVADIKDEELISSLAEICRKKGVEQKTEDIEFKIRSMSEIHEANLKAIREYVPRPLKNPDRVKAWLIRTEGANAVSDIINNPEYLENVQNEKGSMLPLLKGWNDVFANLNTIILNGSNHMDIFHSDESVNEFCSVCEEIYSSSDNRDNKYDDLAIAVIGMSGKFPDADNTDELWENLKRGICSIHKAPEDRGWNIDDYYSSEKKKPGKTYSRTGGFLKDVDKFDPLFFKLSMRDAEMIDPSERIFIEEAWHAIEDAGYSPKKINGKKWGVFSCAKGDYPLLINKELGHHYMPTDSYSATRLSYLLNLTGPAMTLDTACSSTTAAIAEACNSLILGECETAIAGGAGIYCTPDILIASSQSLLLSPDEKCCAFDKNANGTIIAEAAGAFILKPLKKAEEDNDHIYGVIRGWGMNQDGRTNGMTAPNGNAQSRLQTEVYEKFHIDPEKITMIEAHGTGTKLGDAIEYNALKDSFGKITNKKNFCALSSIKPNIGHAFFGAGVAGVAKILLAMKNKQIPPQINFEETSPEVDATSTPFYITTELKDWIPDNGNKRMAAINSFGATGTNVHMVIEEYVEEEKTSEKEPVLFILSAKNKERLVEYTKRLRSYLEVSGCKNMREIAYTLQTGRDAMEERLSFVAGSIDEIKEKLKKFADGLDETAEILSGRIRKKGKDEKRKEEIEKIIDLCVKEKNREALYKLGKAWINGIEVDWEKLYPDQNIHKVSLPGYPFAEDHCWITVNNSFRNETEKNDPQTCINKDINNTSLESSLVLFKEKWIENEKLSIRPDVSSTIICFSSDQENQRIIKSVAEQRYPDIDILFVSKEDDYERLFIDLKEKDNHVSAILYLWAYEDKAAVADYKRILMLLQTISKTNISADKLLLCGGYRTELERCYLESWIGFERSIGPLLSKTRIKVFIEKSNVFDSNTVERVFNEISNVGSYSSVLWKNNKRYVISLDETTLDKKESAIKTGGTYLITGGLGGLGYMFAKYLSQKYKANLVLCGRSRLDDDKKERLETLNKYGAKAVYLQCDISDGKLFKELLDKAMLDLGKIQGVIHAAGTSGNHAVFDKPYEEFANTIAPKIKGVQVIDEVLSDHSLDFVFYFSSSSAILGDFGLCDYSVGNRFMMSYAEYRNNMAKENKDLGKTFCVNWPLWRNGGMSFGSKDDNVYLSKSGQCYLEGNDGLEIFEEVLLQSESQYLVMKGNKEKIYQMLGLDEKNEKYAVQAENAAAALNAETDIVPNVLSDIKKIIFKNYGIPIDKLDVEEHLMEYGFDSINLYEFANELSEYFNINITSAALLGCTSINDIKDMLLSEYDSILKAFYNKNTNIESKPEANKEIKNSSDHEKVQPKITENTWAHDERNEYEPIAVIGMSGKFPQADTVDEFWDNLINNINSITEIPKDRWDWRKYYSGENTAEGKTNSKWGGFIKDVAAFDPLFFRISSNEAKMIDPCQRIFLEEAWKTFEDAGYSYSAVKGSNCGVYVGVEESEYDSLLRDNGDIYGNRNAMLSARIANIMDLKGPNMSITASCSSGLVALHQACQALRSRDCDIALVGGCAVLTTAGVHLGMSALEILSSTGKAAVYDKNADGMVPSEAVVSILLKPLSKAIEDKDHIYGCVIGSGVNYNGQGSGLMTPNPIRESELIKTVCSKYNINTNDIQFVVGHSIGSKMADSAEVEGLRRAFGNQKKNTCCFSSVKPYIGHTFAASGLVSVIALLKAMQHETIFGIPQYGGCSEDINFDNTSLYLAHNNIKWDKINAPSQRIGAVGTSANSGTNAFAVFQEYNANIEKFENDHEQIMVLSGKDEKQLFEMIKLQRTFLEREPDVLLDDIAYTLQNGREAFEKRIAIVAESVSEYKNVLDELIKTGSIDQYNGNTPVFYGDINDEKNTEYSMTLKYEKIMIEEMIKEKDLKALAVMWIKGKKIDWSSLYKEKRYKISMPGYPFKREHFWVDKKKEDMIVLKERKEEEIETQSDIEKNIIAFFADALGISKNDLKIDKPLVQYGAGSLVMTKFRHYIELNYGIRLTFRDFINHKTIKDILMYLSQKINIENNERILDDKNDHSSYCDTNIVKAIEQFNDGKLQLNDVKK